ncbi:MAG: MBL fold metallo-hydrolase [Promethearchaeota archaeon]
MDDELVFLGSGGGRHHIRTQDRATGGVLYKFNDIQAHIDPGPGAIVRINQYHQDPTKTELFIVTHAHIDHMNDISVIIEGSREQLHDRNYNYFKKGTLITTEEVTRFISAYHKNMLQNIVIFKQGDIYDYKGVKITAKKAVHSQIEGFGVQFDLDSYTIVFSSDTQVFDGFAEQLAGVDILVLNLLRPDSITCRRHLCTDEVIPYLNEVEPPLKALILTHFGAMMTGFKTVENRIPNQVEKFKKQTNIKYIIASGDGLNVKISDLLK